MSKELNGTEVHTSTVGRIDFDNKMAETRNTIYRLED